MPASAYRCPRCLHPMPGPDARFCARCGLRVGAAAADAETLPVDLATSNHAYRVMERIAIGEVSNVYRCKLALGNCEADGILKIARDAHANPHLEHEARVLNHLSSLDGSRQLGPFLPHVVETFNCEDRELRDVRVVNVLRYDPQIATPLELCTLAHVRQAHRSGLDARDMAWIWRRLLYVLNFVHDCDVVHGSITPAHVMIEPKEHKLVLVGWTGSHSTSNYLRDGATRTVAPATLAYVHPSVRARLARDGSDLLKHPGLDLHMAAGRMMGLINADPNAGRAPSSLPMPLQRYFAPLLSFDINDWPRRGDALLNEFDRTIESLWGPRQFRPLPMPIN